MTESTAGPRVHRATDTWFSFFVGTYFALVQFSFFFLLEVFLSSRAASFFVALFFWLIGFLIGLNLPSVKRFSLLLILGSAAYYLAMLVLRSFPYRLAALPAVAACIALSGIMAGCFFPYAQERFDKVKKLFLHENNGFILGIVFAVLGSIFVGEWLLSFGALSGLICVLALLAYQRFVPIERP